MKRGLLAAAVIIGLTACGWWSWTRTDRYQIWKIKRGAPQFLEHVGGFGRNAFLPTLVFAGADTEAVATAQKILKPNDRSSALQAVATALAKAGKTTEAAVAARKIDDVRIRTSEMIDVAKALVKAGNLEAARDIASDAVAGAEAIPDDTGKSKSLSELAAVLAQAHSYREARLAAELSTLSTDKIDAFAAILREYTIQRYPERAKLFEGH